LAIGYQLLLHNLVKNIIDETDRMVDMGVSEQIDGIMECMGSGAIFFISSS